MNITVVGDTLLDEDVDGTATRLSPDAPVPVIEIASRVARAGGAGLVARMLAVDGVDVTLVTALGGDAAGDRIRGLLGGVRVVAGDAGAPTPVKTRVRANGLPVARLDEGCEQAPAPQASDRMLRAIGLADAIVVADYGRGLTAHPEIRLALAERAAAVPLVWDPHPRGAAPVHHTALATPNQAEAAAIVGVPREAVHTPAAIRSLHDAWECASVAITLGEDGALLSRDPDGERLWFGADRVATHDPCGAGDRFAASAIGALAAGADLPDAVREAVAAASDYLARGGVRTLAGERPPVPTLASTS